MKFSHLFRHSCLFYFGFNSTVVSRVPYQWSRCTWWYTTLCSQQHRLSLWELTKSDFTRICCQSHHDCIDTWVKLDHYVSANLKRHYLNFRAVLEKVITINSGWWCSTLFGKVLWYFSSLLKHMKDSTLEFGSLELPSCHLASLQCYATLQ